MTVTDRPQLSKNELEVARLVWDLRRATVREVLEALPAERGIEYKTVQTYLRRLEEKGYVRADRAGRSTVFTPLAKPAEVIRDAVGDLVDRLFHGDALPLVEHLVEDGRLTPGEVQRLRSMLEELDETEEGDDA